MDVTLIEGCFARNELVNIEPRAHVYYIFYVLFLKSLTELLTWIRSVVKVTINPVTWGLIPTSELNDKHEINETTCIPSRIEIVSRWVTPFDATAAQRLALKFDR
jgi:hypothetical protein